MKIVTAAIIFFSVSSLISAQAGDECKDAFRGISDANVARDERIDGDGPAYNATGFLADKANPLKYHVTKAFDGKLDTAWAVSTPNGGAGEKLAFLVRGDAAAIEILPGFGRKEYFKLNNRVAGAELRISRIKQRYHTQCVSGIIPGETVLLKQLHFDDEMRLQSFELNLAEKEELLAVLELTDIVKGSRWNDTCIAELVIK